MTDIAALGMTIDAMSADKAAQSLDNLTAAAQKTEAATTGVTKGAAQAAAAMKTEADQATSTAGAMRAAATAATQATTVHGSFSREIVTMGHNSGAARLQMMEMTHVMRAMVDGTMAGINPIRLFAMEIPRIAQAASMGRGGIMGMASSLGLMNPYVWAGIAALAGLGAAFLLVAKNAAEANEVRQFGARLEALGDGAAYSAKQVAESARSIQAFGASAKDARSEVNTFLTEGIKPDRLADFGRVAEYMSKVLGEDVTKAAGQAAKAFTGNWDAVKSLDEQLNFLTSTEARHIKVLFDHNHAAEARNEAYRIFNEKYAKAYNDSLTEGDRLTKSVSGSWDTLTTALSHTTPIENATARIGELVGNLTRWLNQYSSAKHLTDQALQEEADRTRTATFKDFTDLRLAQDAMKTFDKAHPGASDRSRATLVQAVAAAQARFDADNARNTEVVNQIHANAIVPTGDTITADQAAKEALYDAKKERMKKPESHKFDTTDYWRDDPMLGNFTKGRERFDFEKYKDESITALSEMHTKVPQLLNSMRDAFVGFGDAVAQSLGQAITSSQDLGQAIASTFQRMEASYVSNKISELFKFLGNMVFSGQSGKTNFFTEQLSELFNGPPKANAMGGVYNSPSLGSYSNNVYDSPHMFAFAKGAGVFGEAGAEAIMPLKRGADGRLGVTMHQPQQSMVPTIIAPLVQISADSKVVSQAWVDNVNAKLKQVHDSAIEEAGKATKAMFPDLQKRLSAYGEV